MSGCAHCGLPLPPRAPHWQERSFCCQGCLAVFRFIHEAGLDLYYDRRESQPGVPAPEPSLPRYSREALARLEVEGAYHFILDGMHCAACVWLIERAAGRLARVDVNYAMARMRVVFHDNPPAAPPRGDPGEPNVEGLMELLGRLGYRAIPYDPRSQERPQLQRSRGLLLRMGVAGCAAANIMLLAFALYAGAQEDNQFRLLFHWLSLILCLPVMIYSAQPFFKGAWQALRGGHLSGDVPICLGLAVTFGYSVQATWLDLPHVYFDTAATFVFVLLVARNLEGGARAQAGSVIERLLALTPPLTRRWLRAEGRAEEVEVDQLQVGDWVEVLPGEKIPRDGIVREGEGFVDTSALTGESLPRAASPGQQVLGGSISLDGRLLVELQKTAETSLLGQVSRFLEIGAMTPSHTQKRADGVARLFLALSLAAALLCYLAWWLAGGPALYYAVTVLIVTCPCALGIATPLVVAAACGEGARRGLLYRGGGALEVIPRVTHLLLDKTGTLTTGCMEVVQVDPLPGTSADDLLCWAASAEASCSHPIARAILRHYQGELLKLESLRQIPGQGLVARLGRWNVRVGSPSFLGCTSAARIGATCVAVEVDGTLVGRLYLSDTLRPEARAVVEKLQRLYQVAIASGDQTEAVAPLARQLGITDFRGDCTPLDKAAWVQRLQASGAVVAVVGDGINDAPALQLADLGVVVERASDISTEVADVVLLRPGLLPLLESLQLGREAMGRLSLNFGLAGLYNALAIPCAALGWVTPLWAAVAMPLSSLLVTANSVRPWRKR